MGALTQAASTAVLWIHLTREDNCVVCDLRDGMIRHKIVSSVKIVPFVRQLLKSGGHSLVVVDGVANNPKNQAFVDVRSVARTWVMGDAHKRQLVYCASEALSSSGETAIAHGVEGASVAVVNEICSWTLDQVKMACANDDFWTSVKDCVTGGSDYDDRACAIDDKWRGWANDESINHLRGKRPDGKSCVVSDYVTRALLQWNMVKSVEHMTLVSKTLMADNPSFDGWVLELDFLTQLRVASKGDADLDVHCDKQWVNWPVPQVSLGVVMPSDVYNNTLPVDWKKGHWLAPKRFNHGVFDAVYIVVVDGKLAVRFVNVTRSDRHDIKCSYLAQLLLALKHAWTESLTVPVPEMDVEYVWIRPDEKIGSAPITPDIQDGVVITALNTDFTVNWDFTSYDVFIKRSGSA